MADEEGGSGGTLASNDELIAQYQTTRIRSFWAGYKRIFQLTKSAAQTLDPGQFKVTNTFPYGSIVKLSTDEKNADQFIVEADKTTYVYKTAYRAQLLCQLFECISKKVPDKFKTIGPVRAQRLRKNGARVDCLLSIAPYGILEMDQANQLLQEYRWVNVSRLGSDDAVRGFFFQATGRTKIFFVEDVEKLIGASKLMLRMVGMENVPFVRNFDMQGVINQRNGAYAAIPAAVSVFDVNKLTRRSIRPVPRQMHISEEYIVEKDASGFQFSSFQRIDSIYAIVRSWTNPREFAIEFNDGSSRTYTCAVRDTLLAMLLDVCHAANNIRVIVTGEVSDGLRLMPRFAEETYEASLRDAFFGSSSIEAWFLNRLGKACKTTPLAVHEVEQACRELNANVPCPGITPASDLTLVKLCLSGVLRSLNSCLINSYNDEKLDNTRTMCALLQTLFRMIPCVHGFKGFVEVKEVDTRQLMLQLVKFEHDFVNYWTLEVLMVLCRCPLAPRNVQQEFINKHTLLTDKMLTCLIGLMSFRTDAPTEAEIAEANGELAAVEDAPTGGMFAAEKGTAANPSTFSHIPQGSSARAKETSAELLSVPDEVIATASAADLINFTPNSLVVIGAASLLESLVSSRRDTSSPELLNVILDVMAERVEVLISMLRSNSFLIMENAAILMFCLTKNRPHAAPLLKELALSECLVLKHFYNGVFSPSSTQRFISRFLISTWASGSAKTNPGKALLLRMIPSGLAEYLKFAPITAEHRQNLDAMEDDFYAAFVNSSTSGAKLRGGGADAKQALASQSSSSNMQQRMRKRISDSLRDLPVERTSASGVTGPASGDSHHEGSHLSPIRAAPATPAKQPENFRIMFHVMTQDHKLPDLIWNEQTRMELRTTLEGEIREFEREQRLLGTKKIAWNYQQFSVMYESLRDEMQVGPIYVRYFLDAGDTFLRQLENPSHVVLFEKLFRRVLVSVETNAAVSVLCARCLCRLYQVCKDIIGSFDDMLIIVRMLEQATNLELQHCLLDLLVELSADNNNLLHLLDKKFVKSIIRYASLAHINPDQIGNVLARATTNVLMIKDGGDSPTPDSAIPMHSGGTSAEANEVDEEELARKRKRSLWVPEDVTCPKTWYVAPKGQYPPPKQTQRGPFRVSELLHEFDQGRITDDCLVAPISTEEADDSRFDSIVDTGRWKPINAYFQLRLQMLFPGKSVYSPAEVAVKALRLLRRLSAVHRSANSKGVPFFPNPISKRIMSDPDQLALFAQLLLSNDGSVVETAADLLRTLVDFNTTANSKLYLTGAFFFACRYTGNNFAPLAKFFAATHLKQSFQDSAASVARDQHISARSILGSIVPAAMVCMLNNYGPDRFAMVFTGDFDTPEVIWNSALRRHMVEMVDQHIGDFPARLRQFTLAQYEFVPIPKIHYANLDKEIYVHEYYLKNLCDEVRFPEWPISEPLVLLRESIERWRTEMSKGVGNTSSGDAKKLLGLPDNFENKDLRKAYKNLARKYHPDRNPDGREMFEKIHIAYELLSQIEMQATQTDMINVVLLMRTQCIVYRRFAAKVANQKYPAYALLISIISVPGHGRVVDGTAADVLSAGTQLMYYSTYVSPLNAIEFVRAGAVVRLHEVISYALSIVNIASARAYASELLVYALKALTAVSQVDSGQEAIYALCPKFAEDLNEVLALDKISPLAAENSMEVIARCSSHAPLQQALVHAGVIWKLIPFLMAYDNTLKDDYADETQRSVHNQVAANMHAIVATKALGRLGGYMFEELASPENPEVKQCLETLLTQPLARLLRNRRPWDLLESLNENCEKTTKIWNVGMRTELLTFVQKVDQKRTPGSNAKDLEAGKNFRYASLQDELCIGGVYVRIFNKTSETADVDDPSRFCRELLSYIWERVKPDSTAGANASLSAKTTARLHMDYTVEALRTLTEAHGYVAFDVANAPNGIDAVFALLMQPATSATFTSAAQLLALLFAAPEFVVAVADYKPPCVWRLLRCMCTIDVPDVSHVWAAAEALAAHPDGLSCLLDAGAIVQILGTLMAVKGYTNVFHSRLAAISLLGKFLWNPVKGGDASAMLRRFLPEPMVLVLREKAGNASLKVLDAICENPELVWTAEMQGELRHVLNSMLGGIYGAAGGGAAGDAEAFSTPPQIAPDFFVKYRQLTGEIYVGGVYIRLYLKQPTFRLSNPVLFLEKLVEFWESCFNIQVPSATGNAKMGSMSGTAGSDSRALVLGNEDFIGLLTSCIVCVVKGEPSVVDHLITWGFVQNLPVLLQRALKAGRRGIPMVCTVRILFALVVRLEVVENLASCKVDIIEQLTNSLKDGDSIPRDAAVVVELLKKIFQTPYCRYMEQFVSMALRVNLPTLVLNKILGASAADLSHVANLPALRIHAVDLLKAILAAGDETSVAQLQALLDLHPAWRDFKHQSHDLFLTDKEKADVYLIQDAMDVKFAGLLTDGSVQQGINEMFTGKQYYNAQGPLSDGKISGSPFDAKPAAAPARPPPARASAGAMPSSAAPTVPPVPAPAVASTEERRRLSVPSAPAPTMPGQGDIASRRMSTPASAAAAHPTAPVPMQSAPPPPPPASTATRKIYVTTTVAKGELGIGLDLGKAKTGQGQVLRLKEFPPDVVNPASVCNPAIQVGDVIVAVNGVACESLAESVKIIRAAVGSVQLTFERDVNV